MVVEAALGPWDPPVVVELDAPDEGPPAVVARLLPASGRGWKGSFPVAPLLEVEEPLLRRQRDPPGLLQHPVRLGLVPR